MDPAGGDAAEPAELAKPATPSSSSPSAALTPQMSRVTAAWGLLILAGANEAYDRSGAALCEWWFSPEKPDIFQYTAFNRCLLFVVAIVLLLALVRVRELRSVSLSPDSVVSYLTWAILAVVSIYAFEALVIVPCLLLFPPTGEFGNPAAKVLCNVAAAEGPTSTVILVILLAAAAEEILFRGLLLRYLTGLFRRSWLAILLSAVAFGAAHLSVSYYDALVTLWMGLVLGVLYVRRGGLLPVIAAHFLFNFSKLLLETALRGGE